MPVARTQRIRVAALIGAGFAALVGSLTIVPSAQAFHGHRAVVRQPAGISYWGSAYATRGHGRYVYRPSVGYYSAYRPYAYAPRAYVPRVYRPPVYSYRNYGYRYYGYRPYSYGVYPYGVYPYGVYCPPYATYRSSVYYGLSPIGGVPLDWFGAAAAADDGILAAAPVARRIEQGAVPRDVILANGGARQAREAVPARAVAAARPIMQQLLGGSDSEGSGIVRQVVNQVASNRPRSVSASGAGSLGNSPRPSGSVVAASTVAASTEEGRRRASNYIRQGDELFARGRYLEANSVYQRATGVAADSAEAWFRQGFSYLAAGRYERAVMAIQQGVAVEPEYAQSGFRMSQLYGGNTSSLDKHLESLAQAALDSPNNADLVYLVGVALHCDGERERAAPFFAKAADLAGPDASHIAVFQASGFDRPTQPAARTAVR